MKSAWIILLTACGSSASHHPDATVMADVPAPDTCDFVDCAGTCNGPAVIDCSGTCGTRTLDNCGVCDDDPTNDCKWPDSTTTYCSTGTALAACPSSPSGQDGDYLIHVPTFTVDTNTVIDPITGLVWQRSPPFTAITQANAAAYCDGLSLAGADDWRLPTRLELVSIIDTGETLPPFDHTAFPGIPQNSAFWTSTSLAGSAGNSWTIGTNYPSLGAYPDTTSTAMLVRCVRGGPAFMGTFSVVGSSVFDSRTNLFWQGDIAGSTMTWSNAIAYCEGLSLDGHDDWRLPSHKELASIVDDTVTNPAISSLFTMRPASSFWSSSACSNFTTEGYTVDFTQGVSTTSDAFTSTHSVRCVRSNL
jgi:hypothetical protein